MRLNPAALIAPPSSLNWITILLALATLAVPGSLRSQTIDVRFVAIDMQGGAVVPRNSEPGVSFGARLGLADLFGRWLHAGPELGWWTAERTDADLEHRDLVAGLAVWKSLKLGRALRPYLGVSAALHSVDVTGPDGGDVALFDAALARSLDGHRFGVGGFAGLASRLTTTGAIWLLAEYRYTAVSRSSHHEIRAGLRLAGSGL